MNSRHPLLELTLVRFREFAREPEAIFWVFVFPILLAAGLGLAFRNRPAEVLKIVATDPGLVRALRRTATEFNKEKLVPVMALTLSLMMWLVAFLAVGGEWFLMWQSHDWNGQGAAFRSFAVVGLVLLIVLQPDTEQQP